ncbi:restriction endonuclease [Bacillus sp. DTU_2020_1000418_1_SI_GHA_SEK_038]|uniref:restriction endonuclease n=1 Tax=Bacillus sp. DTU_2020_1000418_1_SI_GHA_SEK_038 TaxID=3077585 RepID=UPI0028F0C603|nr:restriction endonuclease [Bacillus sp. DTU_2020_1000418_1_SI_GHA_SEK_038]WNS75477.1 restriction endonuclease [Bacillus sp. DTU_2020_1000418_1_SI_GHA_SEK_038]
MINNFFSEILLSTLNTVNNGSFTKDLLLDKLKADFDYEIEDYDISPILEKCIEKRAIKTLSNGIFVLTEIGLLLLDRPDSAYQSLWNISYLENLEDYALPKGNPFEKKHVESLNDLNEAYSTYLTNLKKYIKHLLISMNEYKFEEFVINILIVSGEAPFGEVTKKSGDGGIDGYLYRTRLKQGAMPVQAKCYEESILISVNDIRDFIGSMHQSHKNGSYFVTTSTFTNKAIEKAKEHGIILLNGNQLVDLIIEFRIGLEPKHNLDFLISPVLVTFE